MSEYFTWSVVMLFNRPRKIAFLTEKVLVFREKAPVSKLLVAEMAPLVFLCFRGYTYFSIMPDGAFSPDIPRFSPPIGNIY